MRLTCFYVFFLNLICLSQDWQNVTTTYIQNPDFEDTVYCPTNLAQTNACVSWYAPTQGTSDYYNLCNNFINGNVGVPNSSAIGYQQTFSGNGFMGFLAYSTPDGMWSEYIQTKLKTSLIADRYYKFTMRINRADGYNFSVKNIGADFSTLAHSSNITRPLILNPSILNSTFLDDTLNFQLVQGIFKAKVNTNFLTIGWFGGDTITDDYKFLIEPLIEPITGESLYLTETYYVVDSLTLFESEKLNFVLDLPNVITTNQDNTNDTYKFKHPFVNEFDYTIVNRWGNAVYNNIQQEIQWNGITYFNQKISDGVYFIRGKARTIFDETVEFCQFITVIN